MADTQMQQNMTTRRGRPVQEQVKKYECLRCFRLFATVGRLKRHSVVHSTEKKIFHCQFCESTFRLHTELLSHETTHTRTLAHTNLKRCKICGVACHNDNLVEHFKEHHEHFECDLCKKVYHTKNHLKLHMITHINARQYKCSTCSKAFNFLSILKRHMSTHTATAVWCCEICGVGFKCKPNLSHHMRSHNGDKPYRCDRCDRCFSAKQSLLLHIRIHDGDKPYKCPFEQCGRCFNDLATMKVHTRIHTNENPYKCHLCGKTTKQASNLKSHYLHAHKIKDITSKTIRLNARLFEKYKTEDLPEAGLLEILSQQVVGNIEKIEMEKRNEVKVFTLNRITTLTERDVPIDIPVANHENKVETEVTTITNEEELNRGDFHDMASNSNEIILFQSDIEIKMEISFEDENFPNDDVQPINDLAHKTDLTVNKSLIKEEACDAFIADDASNIKPIKSFENAKESGNLKTLRKSHRMRQKSTRKTIEEVFIDEKNNSIVSTKVEVKKESMQQNKSLEEMLNIQTEGTSGFCDIKIEQIQSEPINSLVKFVPPPSTGNWSAVTVPVRKVQKNQPVPLRNNFKCDICPRKFKQEMQFTLHKKSHQAKDIDKIKICEICGKTYRQNSALQKHLKFAHSNFRPYPCMLCDRAFKDSTGLKVHLRSHSGEKPYTCSFCPKTFSTSMGKNLHQRGHTGEKPYKCQYCDSAFSDNSTYRQHVRVHTGEKPYVCHLCGRGTTQAGNLKSHLRHAHKLKIKNVSMTKT